MHMRFTDEELLTLSEMLTLACWATFYNHKPGAEEGVARYDDMLEKVLRRMQDNGQGSEVEYDPERRRLRLRKDREDGSFYAQSYDELRNELFWEELVARLSERELNKKYGVAAAEKLSEDERKRLSEPVTRKYWDEFSRNGIANLHVVAKREDG